MTGDHTLWYVIPDATVRAAQRAFPKGNPRAIVRRARCAHAAHRRRRGDGTCVFAPGSSTKRCKALVSGK
jgi:hypothetical protein